MGTLGRSISSTLVTTGKFIARKHTFNSSDTEIIITEAKNQNSPNIIINSLKNEEILPQNNDNTEEIQLIEKENVELYQPGEKGFVLVNSKEQEGNKKEAVDIYQPGAMGFFLVDYQREATLISKENSHDFVTN